MSDRVSWEVLPDGRRIPRLTITGQQPKELSDDEVFGVQAPRELTDEEVFAQQPRTLTQDLGRQLGLTGRAVGTGLPAIPMILGDATNAALNLGSMGINKVAGTNIPMLDMPSQALQDVMTRAGVPKPENLQERAVQAGGAALTGAGAMSALANALRSIPGIPAAIAEMMGQAPLVQGIGAGLGAAGTDYAREQGVKNPAALMGIALGTSVLPGAAKTAVARPLAGIGQAIKPLVSRRGIEELAGSALNRVATNPESAAARLAAARQIVPGSRPMVSDVSRDPGLIGAESALRGMDERNLIGARRSEQNAARMRELDTIARDEGTLQRATDKRGRTFQQMAEPAFENATPTGLGREWINNPILRRIQQIRETPAGARSTVREALDEAQDLITQDGVDLNDARTLYEIRKDLDLLRTGKLTGAGKSGRERSNMQHARTQFDEVVRAVDDVIEQSAPGYRDYMQMFAKRSIPLEQLKALQSLRARAVLAAPDPVTNEPIDILSQAKFKNLLRSNVMGNTRHSGRGPGVASMRATVPGTGEKVLGQLSANQLNKLDRIAEDLDRGAAVTASTIRPPGSETFKNMSVAAVIGRVLGDKTGAAVMESQGGKNIARPLSFLYRVPDQQVQLLMLEAWQDPQLAARLMRQATRAEIEGIAQELGTRAARQSAAASLYSGE